MGKEVPVGYSKAETYEHKALVLKYLNRVIQDLIARAEVHDDSKLEEPELSAFDKAARDYPLGTLTYGSPEYQESVRLLGPALEHHYAVNRHHPQHFPDGVRGMNLVDLIEMICDWKASTFRQPGGNLLKSIHMNATPDKFNYTQELSQIFENTADFLED